MNGLVIVIPCFNEAARLPFKSYQQFLRNSNDVSLFFVNDGSTDTTLALLQQLKKNHPEKVAYLDVSPNQGKAEAVRRGMQVVIQFDYLKFAYLDADLSTSLEECTALAEQVDSNLPFVFASRILKIDNHIQRKWHRFLIGRIVATIISKMLGIKVYDTQCGCKIFERETATALFEAPFLSKWLFDVELFFRMINRVGRENMGTRTKEVPLKQWIDTVDSRVQLSYGFVLWLDLIKIYIRYR
ncbi:MAG: glycosyltransferase [Flavobacteriaceae bacterium]